MTTTAEFFCEAFNLNREAVLALSCGKSLRFAVGLMKDSLAQIGRFCCFPDDSLHLPSTADSNLACTAIPIQIPQDPDFYIFDHAMIFHSRISPQGRNISPSHAAYLSAVITFNTALAYHKLGRETGGSEQKQKAAFLYMKSIEMASSLDPVVVGDAMYVLQMVASNNAAQIYREEARFDVCAQVLSCVQERPRALMKFGFGPLRGGAFVLGEQLEQIILNMVAVSIPMSAPSA